MTIPVPTPRAKRVTALFDFTAGHGLEIGPLDAALVPRDAADVSYADVFPREQLAEHYSCVPYVKTDQIPEIDFPLWDGERVRTLNEAAKPGAPFDWVYASHVIEHVPDLIGWLGHVAELTSEDGALVLVVPDQRFSFDAHRPPTTVGQLIQAHDDGDTIPSVRAVYDHHRSAIDAQARVLWKHKVPGYEARVHDVDETLVQVGRARAGEYIDCHVWLFTPETLVAQLEELREVGLTEWWVDEIQDTPRNELEFIAVLRRGPRQGDVPAPATQPAWVAELQSQRAEVARLRGVVRQQRRELRELRESKRWKAAALLAAPFDALRGRR